MQDLDKELERDIGYALSQSVFKVKGQRIEAMRLVAAGVVAHLRRAGWRFGLRPPDPLHGPATAAGSVSGADASASNDPARSTLGAEEGDMTQSRVDSSTSDQ
jgi:hypothetical protein